MPCKQSFLCRCERESLLRRSQHWSVVVCEHISIRCWLVKLAPDSTLLKSDLSPKADTAAVGVLWMLCRIEQALQDLRFAHGARSQKFSATC